MKASGFSWIGGIPDGWLLPAMGRYVQFCNGADYKDVEVAEGGYPVLGSGGEFRRASDYLFEGESVLFGRKGTIDKPLHVSGRFWTVDTMFYTKIDSAHLLPRFLFYYALTIPFMRFSTSTALPSMTQADLASIRMPLPSLQEQLAIADFLDRETEEIDAFIADQDELVAVLQERRSAVITRAVTKGLDSSASMKPSGVEWLGQIPAEWTAGNIRRFARMRTGHTPSRSNTEYWQDCEIPWFTLGDVWQLRQGAKFLGETREKISRLGLDNSAAELLPRGTVVLSRTASVGFSGIMPAPMATSQDYWNWICGPELHPEFLWYQFAAMKQYFASLMHGSTHKTIYQSQAASLTIAVPPIVEQKQIVTRLDDECSETDAAIADAKEAIEVSKERRAALISAAVTGKIDVRNHVATMGV